MDVEEIIKRLSGPKNKKREAALSRLNKIARRVDAYFEPIKEKKNEEAKAKAFAEAKPGQTVKYKQDCGPSHLCCVQTYESVLGKADTPEENKARVADCIRRLVDCALALDEEAAASVPSGG